MQFQKKNIRTAGRSLENPRGRGVLETKIVQAKYEAKLNFLGGGGGVQKPSIGGMDIFRNCTLLKFVNTLL